MNIFVSILHKLKSILNGEENVATPNLNLNKTEVFDELRQKMIDLACHSTDKGISEESVDGEQYVVSLTTHGSRIERVFQAIESIFQQSRKVQKVVLYLSDKEFQGKELPLFLQKQMERGLDIRYVKDIGPYTKLIPALRDFPDVNIITIDDDHIYPLDLIDRLISAHSMNPKAVCCINACLIEMKDGALCNTTNPFIPYYVETYTSSPHHFALGYSGVLYPPHALHEEVFNEEKFMKLCPKADDIWFKAMELLQGTSVLRLPTSLQEMKLFWQHEDPTYQYMGLKKVNVDKSKNYVQLKAVLDYYKLYDKLK